MSRGLKYIIYCHQKIGSNVLKLPDDISGFLWIKQTQTIIIIQFPNRPQLCKRLGSDQCFGGISQSSPQLKRKISSRLCRRVVWCAWHLSVFITRGPELTVTSRCCRWGRNQHNTPVVSTLSPHIFPLWHTVNKKKLDLKVLQQSKETDSTRFGQEVQLQPWNLQMWSCRKISNSNKQKVMSDCGTSEKGLIEREAELLENRDLFISNTSWRAVFCLLIKVQLLYLKKICLNIIYLLRIDCVAVFFFWSVDHYFNPIFLQFS